MLLICQLKHEIFREAVYISTHGSLKHLFAEAHYSGNLGSYMSTLPFIPSRQGRRNELLDGLQIPARLTRRLARLAGGGGAGRAGWCGSRCAERKLD
jgi:hypothetical protein